ADVKCLGFLYLYVGRYPRNNASRNRKMFGSCLAGAVGSEPLIGQLVLKSLDLIVDCPRNALRPRPESPGCPSYKLK
ncbi:MAG: hypothetical protein BECKG1743E_GA0114224_106721, partial [Candidatus Kentron sp. G]